jgi:hypothetical protein
VNKDPVSLKEKIIFYQDNAPANKSALKMGKLKKLHNELMEHYCYSPDLNPSDFCLFPKLKIFFVFQRFPSNQEAITAVKGYFADLKNEPLQGQDNCA